jgi:chromosomal replication initiator protein
MGRFKRKFRRDCDVLVVEDVHFLEGKESTQLEFFHSVQHVLDAGGRVVLTGSRLPRSLSALEPRVRAQLAGGFVAELGPPDAQVRRNILRAKAAAGGVRLPQDCLEVLVDAIHGNVRELEGVLIQLVTTASLLKRPIDLELTREALEKKAGTRAEPAIRRLEPVAVLAAVAAFFKTTPDVMASKSRRRDVLAPRQLAMYLCHEYTDASLVEIGRMLGRDHPSVRNAITKIERKLLENAPLRYQVKR